MEWHLLVCSTIILLAATIFIILKPKASNTKNRLPPGPPGWPLFGHMFQLGSSPHRAIAALKPKYGPVVWLKLGSVNTMAVLTAKAASDFFKNHDLSFADRTIVDTMTAHGYHIGSLALSPHGPRWRLLRRICTAEMSVHRRVNETAGIRRRCVDDMLSWFESGNAVPVGRYAFLAAFNMLGNMMMSMDLVDPQSEKGMEFYGAMKRVMEWSGRPNVSDLFPWIGWMDLQGLKRRANRDMGVAFGVVSEFVRERIRNGKREGEGRERDFLDLLLEFGGESSEKLSETEIIFFILEIFMAGTETTSTSIEWAMAELLRNPATMAKARSEISALVGPTEKFEESHIENLPYLQAVVKETLRLHPPLPFLIPRRATGDTDFMGYLVPKNTQVFINVWAIGRDEECWDEGLSFRPERFLDVDNSNVDYRGQHFELIPFGAGRRMCAGLDLGHRMLHLVLGSLLHEFEWAVEDSFGPDGIDMSERMGITVGKLKPLRVVPRKHVM